MWLLEYRSCKRGPKLLLLILLLALIRTELDLNPQIVVYVFIFTTGYIWATKSGQDQYATDLDPKPSVAFGPEIGRPDSAI